VAFLKSVAYSRRAKRVIYLTFVFAALCFVAFILGNLYLGGNAANGYVRAGHYYVCAHRSCSEVSSAAWHYSYWNARIALGGMLLVFAEVAILMSTRDIKLE
jgi:hypothetical protein